MSSRNPVAGPATSHHGTAVLDRTSGPLRDAAGESGRSGHNLEPLEGVNPLGVPLDRQREWYHSQAIQRMQQAGLLGP